MGISREDLYILDRNPEESARLNKQHEFLVDLIGGHPIHPSIPTENITAVADVATGTGIWLSSLPKSLPSPNDLYLHGFDISTTQFPFYKDITPTYEIYLSAHDARDRFPEDHRGRYDLVHLRLLVGAFKEEDYMRTVQNVYELLKPGGYLQWDECDCSAFTTAESPPSALARQMQQVVVDAVHNLGLAREPPKLIEKFAGKIGFVDVSRRVYSTLDKPHLHATASAWVLRLMAMLLPNSFISSGKEADREVAMRRAQRLLKDIEEHCARVLPLVNLQVIVGRKPV
ncbi:hypothetical protein BDV59DRAFT_159117 [Aspergillus ambiguus]|uniref:putative LaeA-like methyltransferase n=1 Tax=Aspergillus ambiguus TaxID=176160 RepID=UPI003CCD421B